jgi:hypothetical protein
MVRPILTRDFQGRPFRFLEISAMLPTTHPRANFEFLFLAL